MYCVMCNSNPCRCSVPVAPRHDMTPSVKRRIAVEMRIARALIESALDAGYSVTVNDSEEDTLHESTSLEAILGAMFTSDMDRLFLFEKDSRTWYGWVLFIYGNDGWDVISDYTCNLEPIMGPANELSEQYA